MHLPSIPRYARPVEVSNQHRHEPGALLVQVLHAERLCHGNEQRSNAMMPSLSALRTSRWLPSLKAAQVLWRDYAHLKTVRTQRAVNRAGEPLPWYTYPAI